MPKGNPGFLKETDKCYNCNNDISLGNISRHEKTCVLRDLTCVECGSSFRIRQIKTPMPRFCSSSCFMYWRNRDNPSLARDAGKKAGEYWASQRGTGDNSKGYIKENNRHQHRVVVERHLGRKLLPTEIIHHIDGNPKNNDWENLEITNRSDHIRHHLPEMIKAKKDKYGR